VYGTWKPDNRHLIGSVVAPVCPAALWSHTLVNHGPPSQQPILTYHLSSSILHDGGTQPALLGGDVLLVVGRLSFDRPVGGTTLQLLCS
jgi:hypothetical protein